MYIYTYIHTISTSKWNKIHASYSMYIFIYIYIIHKCISKYSQSTQQVQDLPTKHKRFMTKILHKTGPSFTLPPTCILRWPGRINPPMGHLSRVKDGWEQAVSGQGWGFPWPLGGCESQPNDGKMRGKSSPSQKVLQLGQDFSLLLTLWFHVSNWHPSEQQATPRFPPPFSCSVKGVWQAPPFQ